MSRFKPGDRVIVAYRHDTFSQLMDKYIGGSFQIESHTGRTVNNYYRISNDDGLILGFTGIPWLFHEDCLMKAGPYAKYHVIAREICGR